MSENSDDLLESRLREMERPEAQGDALDKRNFIKLVVVTLVIPAILLLLGWAVMPS